MGAGKGQTKRLNISVKASAENMLIIDDYIKNEKGIRTQYAKFTRKDGLGLMIFIENDIVIFDSFSYPYPETVSPEFNFASLEEDLGVITTIKKEKIIKLIKEYIDDPHKTINEVMDRDGKHGERRGIFVKADSKYTDHDTKENVLTFYVIKDNMISEDKVFTDKKEYRDLAYSFNLQEAKEFINFMNVLHARDKGLKKQKEDLKNLHKKPLNF